MPTPSTDSYWRAVTTALLKPHFTRYISVVWIVLFPRNVVSPPQRLWGVIVSASSVRSWIKLPTGCGFKVCILLLFLLRFFVQRSRLSVSQCQSANRNSISLIQTNSDPNSTTTMGQWQKKYFCAVVAICCALVGPSFSAPTVDVADGTIRDGAQVSHWPVFSSAV